MRSINVASLGRTGLILISLLVLGGGIFMAINYIVPANPSPEITLPSLNTPTPVKIITPTNSAPTAVAMALAATATGTNTPTPAAPTATATPGTQIPPGGIVYALSPDINSVGWVQTGDEGNHFGESYLYAGIRRGDVYYGAMQFDLAFLPKGSTIFGAELELTGLDAEGITNSSLFEVKVLTEDIDPEWSRHDFEAISNANVDETLTPVLEAAELSPEQANTLVFNAAQRSIIEDRLGTTHLVSFRIDSLFQEGWFAWDSGYGPQTNGQGPVLRLGVLPPVATDEAAVPPDSTPTPTPTFIIITSTPTPENLSTAAAMAPTATYEATTTGTPTPLPLNWVTPLVVTNTPIPENAATAQFQQVEATSAVIAFGTSTPTPQNLVTATSTPTETPTPVLILLEGDLPPVTPTPTIAATLDPPPPVPAQLIGKIAFKSDRSGEVRIYVMNPDGSGLAVLTAPWPYNVAEQADVYSADGRFRVFTKDTVRQIDSGLIDLNQKKVYRFINFPTLFWRDALYGNEERLTYFGAGMAYAGVWSPTNEEIALVSDDSGDDEIWVVNRDGSNLRQLTESNEAYNAEQIGKDTFVPEVNRHPSWSPDSQQIVFWTNRYSGRGQIWVMDADGGNSHQLSKGTYNDWDPVWIKYPGFPPNALANHNMLYNGPYEPFGLDKNCEDFSNLHETQQFYYSAGGPARDPHNLDRDSDGIVCNEYEY